MEETRLPRNRIRELAKPFGGLQKLAEQANFNFCTLSQVVNLKRNATIGTLQQLADALGIPFWQLFVSPEDAAKWNEGNSVDELPFEDVSQSSDDGFVSETVAQPADLITVDPLTGETHRYRRID